MLVGKTTSFIQRNQAKRGFGCLAAPAWAAEVVSSNIVGYTKVSVTAGLSIVGQQFVAVGGGDQNIQSITASGLEDGGVDFIRIWNGTGYNSYSYFSADDDIAGTGSAAWGNDDWEVVDVDFAPGTGMWLSAQNDATITFSGEVGNGNTVSFSAGLNLITPPQPTIVNIQDIQAVGLSDGGIDFIRVWNGSGYVSYSYFSADDDIAGTGKAAWGNDDWEPVDVSFDPGLGMWLSAQNSGTLTFPNALAE